MVACGVPDPAELSTDAIYVLKRRIKRHQALGTLAFWLVDLLYLDLRERRRFVRGFAPGARLLNLGAGFRRSPPGFWAIDAEDYTGLGARADLAALPFACSSVDGILCESVLEHVREARQALAEMARVLKPGGELFLAVPFLWPFHSSPHDYWRWTERGLCEDLHAFEVVGQGVMGGPTTTLVLALQEWLAMLLSLGLVPLYRLWLVVLVVLLSPLKLFDLLLSRHPEAHKLGALLWVRARKSTARQP